MALSRPEVQHLLERLIFDESTAEEWVQDVWGLSPTVGETAAKLVDVFQALCDRSSAADLEELLLAFYQDRME